MNLEEKIKDGREYRRMTQALAGIQEDDAESYNVRGYATTFNEKYTLFEGEGYRVDEQVDPHAFDECDMTDVVFRVDHEGAVYARSSAGTLEVGVDEHGLYDRADLSKTAKARELFEDIQAGNYPKQSFAFTVKEDSYNKETHTRTILKIAKLYDVSPVSFPANPTTELDVATRDYFNGVIEMERAERLEAEKREKDKKRLELKLKLMED